MILRMRLPAETAPTALPVPEAAKKLLGSFGLPVSLDFCGNLWMVIVIAALLR